MSRIISYLKYKFNALNRNGHGIHSPFIYDFVTTVINPKKANNPLNNIEQHRKILKMNTNSIYVTDLGTGQSGQRKISTLSNKALTPKKESELIYRITKHLNPNTGIELGTSFGINSLYLSNALSDKTLYTIEGSIEIAQLASQLFVKENTTNIHLYNGDFENQLPKILDLCSIPFVAYIDGNHCYKATINYFNIFLNKVDKDSVLIFHDIHLNKEMERAWREIHSHEKVIFSIDLFKMGILFFNKKSPKQHFVVDF